MKEGIASNINYNIAYCFFLPVVFYYCLFMVNDQISNLFLFLSLLSATSVFNSNNHKKLHISIGLLSLIDAVVKGLMVYQIIPKVSYLHLDLTLITDIINLNFDSLDYKTLIYFALIILSLICAFSYNTRLKSNSQTYEQLKFLQFLSTTLDYATPFLLYILCFTKLTNNNSFRDWIQKLTPQIPEIQIGQFQMFEQVGWGLITSLYLINRGQSNTLRKLLAIFTIILIIRDNIVEFYDPGTILYQIKWKYITTIKIALLVFFRIHNKTTSYTELVLENEETNARSVCQSRISSHMKYVNRRKINQMQSLNHIFVLLLIVLTIITMTLTNGLGNVLVIIGLALNFPNYQQNKFRNILGVGVTISLLLQPEQFIYFAFLYLIRMFSTQNHVFNLRNWWIVMQLMRIVVLFSKVSLLNFLIGLFQSYWLVVFTLIFRTCCSFFGQIIVFMGTEDYYSYFVQNIIPSSVFIDIILWTYFILLKIYSPISSVRFESTDITNIFIQYPFINSIQKVLKVLKIFHWIAYAAISLVILNSQPSLFTLMRIIPLVVAFTVGILQTHKSSLTYRLWSWNLYTSIAIAFVKYFYLLSQYDNLSLWLIRLLDPLMEHYQFIGLTPPTNVSLPILFGPDFFLIIVNAVVLYIVKVEVQQLNYEAARARIYQQQHLQSRLLDNEEQKQEKGVHYLYNKYIKPINIDFKGRETPRLIFTDFILDISFCCFLIVFYIFPSNQFQPNYAPHFGLFLFGFLKQKGKHLPNHFFQIFVGICSVDLLFIYGQYFYSLIKGKGIDYDITSVVSKYLLLIIGVIFKQISFSLKRFYQEHQVIKRPEHTFLLFHLLTPPISNEQIKKQIIVLYLHLFKILSLSFFFSALISGDQTTKIIHIIVLIVSIFIFLVLKKYRNQFFKRIWMKIFIFGILMDLYVGHLQTILCLIFLRGYFMMLEQFDLFIFVEKYDRTNKTANEQCMKNIEKKEEQLHQKYNIPNENRLQVILEVPQILQHSLQDKTNEDMTDWKHKNTYITIVWLLPIVFIFVTAIGVLFYIRGFFGFIFSLLNFVAVFIALIKLFNFTINNTIAKWLVLLGSVMILISLIYEIGLKDENGQQILQNYGFGLFLILVGTLGYFQLLRYNNNSEINSHLFYSYFINFSQKRSIQACQYWKKKCQMVSELGSQIHNEKKMTSLRKFFLNRQNLGVKVEQLQNELKSKSAHRKSRFQSLQKLQSEQQREQTFKKDQFQVYSNMLTFMSLEDLQFCYLNLNQYYKGDIGVHIDLPEVTSKVRQWILENYSESFSETIQRYQQIAISSQLTIVEQPTIKVLPPSSSQKQLIVSRILEDLQQNKVEQNKIQLSVRFASQSENILEQSTITKDKMLKQRQKIGSSLVSNSSFPSRLKQEFGQRIDMRLNELSWPIRKLVQNIEILGLIITAGWNFFGGVYTIPTNIAIFSWAIVLQTKTTVVFWLFLMSYSFVILSCKLLIQYLPKHFFINFLFYYHPNDYLYEFIIILVSAIEIIFLKMGGTSEIAYSQRQNIFDAFYRNILNQSSRGKRKEAEPKFLQMYKSLRHSHKHSFFHRVFSKGRLKPGKDLYPLLAILQVIILLYIFFFYDMMQFQSKNNRKSLGQILTVTQFSKNMILALFFQVMIMIVDRLIVSLNFIDRLNQKLQNFFFNMAFKSQMKYSTLEPEQLSQMAKFDFLLIIKYIFHVSLLVIINFFVYFYIPSGGMQKSLIPECENAVCGKSYNYLSLFLFLYLIYFVISGLQIKHGFNRNKCRNTLMERYHWIDYYIYVFFTGIPFLWEFKKISDWTTTATALPLFHWMKFEDINARMYRSKCQAEILRIKTLGKGPWYKWFIGPPGFFFILAIIFSPIIMYSSLNPFAVKDSILAASSRLELVMNGNIHYEFFQTSHTTILDDSQFNQKQKLLGLFDRADLYKLQTSSYPDQDFTLSEPALIQMAETLREISFNQSNSSIQFRLIMEVSEKIGGDTSIIWGSKMLSKYQVDSLYQTVTSNVQRLQITKFFSPLPGQIANQSIILLNRNHGQYYELYTTRLNVDNDQQEDNLPGVFVFYKSSVKYKIAFGLLTFYLTYVVLINSLCRFYLTGGLETVLFEGPQLQKILFLCEAVRSARILENFYQEQYLYFSLVDLMRYPRMIKDIADDFSNLRTEAKMKQQ